MTIKSIAQRLAHALSTTWCDACTTREARHFIPTRRGPRALCSECYGWKRRTQAVRRNSVLYSLPNVDPRPLEDVK